MDRLSQFSKDKQLFPLTFSIKMREFSDKSCYNKADYTKGTEIHDFSLSINA
ncbi:hypothetical protein HMPREF0813_00978 [Streptococcus anginosus F0211]|uniref:Uncharacterized protein n=1 Tax=Streptococcus anginosus F0211 TaxID=706437 RepID=E6J154_STRAP|nr:hypothetical protein HMPREF0813_00978 [Streptococcus anginosus F0211]GAD42578.1 hypothetical protein ANG4_1171 [Streptococcus anginosus 1505]